MKNRHDWTEDGVPHSVDCRALAHDSWVACLQREILRLAGFKETLEQVALAAGCPPTQFPDAYGHVLERVAGLAARVKELEGDVKEAAQLVASLDEARLNYHQHVRSLEETIAARDGTLYMAVARLGGLVDGRPTERVNFLQRIDALRRTEERVGALEVTNEESQEIIGELSMALAIGCEEGLIPCVEPCKGHLGPKANKVTSEAYALWSSVEEELVLLRAVEAQIIKLNEPVGNKGSLYADAWNGLMAFRQRNKQEEEG